MASIKRCCICGNIIIGEGNDPKPLIDDYDDNVCCDYCYATKVIPYALKHSTSERGITLITNISESSDGGLYIKGLKIMDKED